MNKNETKTNEEQGVNEVEVFRQSELDVIYVNLLGFLLTWSRSSSKFTVDLELACYLSSAHEFVSSCNHSLAGVTARLGTNTAFSLI
ncbi:hypothetical protein F2Q70_00021166 [Brassica cretica]|uniref:Uncharacterized protein n=1 Tax=Brassica cretica TaxID=69181 RepID=A0A8S9GZD1_BRACR|nr:hypothetical protein F2Q70_00021166 [Brassica cretica]